MKRRPRKNDGVKLFWRDVCIAGGQVTFGVFAALLFVPPFDKIKIGVLLFNASATTAFILSGLKIAKDI